MEGGWGHGLGQAGQPLGLEPPPPPSALNAQRIFDEGNAG